MMAAASEGRGKEGVREGGWYMSVGREGWRGTRKKGVICFLNLALKAVTFTRPDRRESSPPLSLSLSLHLHHTSFTHRGLHDYTLILNPDLYSKRHVQWYYFRVTNMEAVTVYTFHIVNFEKTDSLYNHGM